ncbi:MAG: thiol-disulfide oxidoreductase DCC family protein [Phycisphaerales bacterium]
MPVILFDGDCNLCNNAVRWVIARDRRAVFSFASLQSEAARNLLQSRAANEFDIENLPDTVVMIDEKGVHIRSAAAIRIARSLGFPWSLLRVFMIVPRPVRDWVYNFIARRRYRWFGRGDSCMVPTPELRERFLDRDEP